MHKITVNKEKNRIYISLVGFVSEAEAKDIRKMLSSEINSLAPLFDVITDISNFRLGLEQSSDVLREIIKLFIGHKVGRIIRVVGSSQAGMLQFATYTGNDPHYKVSYVPTMEDAENLLEEKSEMVKK
jgi:hypothetical protein